MNYWKLFTRYVTGTLMMLYIGTTHAQSDQPIKIGLGYMVSTQSEIGYGKAYMSLGIERAGIMFHFGGDSRIGVGHENKGNGYVGGSLWVDLLEDSDFQVRPFLGVDVVESWEVRQVANYYHSFFTKASQQKLTNSDVDPIGGVSLGWKNLELTITSKLELGIGVKFTY